MIRVVCISDTHTHHESVNLPHGDILVHAGDISFGGREAEVRSFGEWMRRQPHLYKIVIAGNHDWSFERNLMQARAWLRGSADDPSLIYLQDSRISLSIDGRTVNVYGSPWQPEFCDWAFNLRRGKSLKDKWDRIPTNTDILITHGPPQGILDLCEHGERVGCEELLAAVNRIKPKLHVFGHIHEAYGVYVSDGTKFVNASSCTARYKPTNQPVVVEI